MTEPFDSVFREVDLLLVVDEWKTERSDTEPQLLLARGFTAVGRSTLPMYRLLVDGGAADWHARGARSEHEFLFNAPQFDLILAELGNADTRLYEHLFHDLAHFDHDGPADPNWRRITANARRNSVWRQAVPRQGRALFWFIELLLRGIQPRLGSELLVRVVIDRQDWLSSRAAEPDNPGFFFLGARRGDLNAEVFAVADRTHPAVAPYLPFLGLVDSEAWAFGRQLALKLPDGTRVHDRCMEWLRDGHPDATNMLAEFNAAFDEVHAEHTNLTRYLETQYSWYPRHLIDLESLIPAVDSQE